MEYKDLIQKAMEAKVFSYSPYSKFRVGAALLTMSGIVYTGANIENASYGATNCAERTAVFKAVSEGKLEIKAIAIASDMEDYIYPCGICRQVLSEFGKPDMEIICSKAHGEYKVITLEQLIPHVFRL